MDMFILQVYLTLLDKQTGFQSSSTFASFRENNQVLLDCLKEYTLLFTWQMLSEFFFLIPSPPPF